MYIYIVTCWLHLFFLKHVPCRYLPQPCRLPHLASWHFRHGPGLSSIPWAGPVPQRGHDCDRFDGLIYGEPNAIWIAIWIYIYVHIYIYIYPYSYSDYSMLCWDQIYICSNHLRMFGHDEFGNARTQWRLMNFAGKFIELKGADFPVATIIRTEVLAHENILGLSAMGQSCIIKSCSNPN